MKKFTPNLLEKFTPHLLSPALAEHDCFEPQIALITQIFNELQIYSPADNADFRRGFSTTDLSSPFKFSKDFQIDFQ